MTTVSEPSVIASLREYLIYLLESGVDEIGLPVVSPESIRSAAKSEVSSLSLPQETLEEIEAEFKECSRCGLSKSRTHIVFGRGNQSADILFVIDEPNLEEDKSGQIVRGESGKKLEEIIEKGMNLSIAEVYICPLIKCRGPQGRALLNEDIASCISVFNRQLSVIAPKVIIALGARVAQILLGSNIPIEQLRGTWQTYRGIPVMPTYHPAYVLENYTIPIRKQVWNDVSEAIRYIGAHS